ncbi:CDP-glycerol glycerophosphotransferase family protein [Vagococcus sp.]|uniref:CDP-glycerol glycerophosphotransferase family protein n=1 Tax=Vagococcus sp. TaxID=1933889 RepID=UPI003F9BA59C
MKRIAVSLVKSLYDGLVRLFSFLPIKTVPKQLTYLLSFPNNNKGLIEKLALKYQVTVFYTEKVKQEALSLEQQGIKIKSLTGISGLFSVVRSIQASEWCLCDNYFAFLGSLRKPKALKIVQLWHATGAIKTFGLEDQAVKNRTQSDQKRFKRVYASFDYVVVASEAMAAVFKRSYNMTQEQIWPLGFSRTDDLVRQRDLQLKPKKKKRLLYLPTYREYELAAYPLDIALLQEELGEEYELWIKEHPHSQWPRPKTSTSAFLTYVSSEKGADELLLEADVLITDYSSVAFDYSLVKPQGRLLFYWFDEKRYRSQPGLQDKIEILLPNSFCFDTQTLINKIKFEAVADLSEFNKCWNTYNDGQATKRLLKEMDRYDDNDKIS